MIVESERGRGEVGRDDEREGDCGSGSKDQKEGLRKRGESRKYGVEWKDNEK